MTTRARFEKWAESNGWNIDRTDEGDYRTMSTDAAWGGWIACAEEAERIYARECTEWARICEYQKRHGCKVGAQECAKIINGWRANNEAPNDLGNRRDAGPIGGASVLTDELAGKT